VAFSGDKTFSVTRDDLINAALRKLSAYDSAAGAAAYELTDAAFTLNAILKEWAAEGLAIWLRQKTVVFLNRGQPYYWLGPNPANDATNRIYHQACESSLFKEATILATEAAGQTILSIGDTAWLDINQQTATKPAAGQIGIRLDDLTIHWTTVSGVGVDTVTVAGALPSQASTGAKVYAFTTRTSRPIRVLQALRRDTSGIDTSVGLIGRNDYEALSSKFSSGEPLQVCFEPMVQEQTSSALHSRIQVWPVDNSLSCDLLLLLTEHYPDDLDASSNNPQFPAEWANAIIWNLASELAPEYGVSDRERAQLDRQAMMKKAVLFSLETENASVSFAPSMTGA
jgi:hypothetical protein